MEPVKISWHRNTEARIRAAVPPALAPWFYPIGFPPPWPKRPWIFGVMVSSLDGVVAWKRRSGEPHPVEQILGGDRQRPECIADLLLMRYLRSLGDCSVGAETQRDQRGLIQTPREAWEDKALPDLKPVADALYRFREAQGLTRHPRNIRYSRSGRVDRDGDLSDPLFSTPGVETIVITTEEGSERLIAAGSNEKGVKLVVEPELDATGLARTHERLMAAHDVSYLACEGGEGILASLREAGLLDEVFVTTAGTIVGAAGRENVRRLPDYAAEGAELVAEGRISSESSWTFRRWRINKR